jgi:predicted adenylyl cyclase CyaB
MREIELKLRYNPAERENIIRYCTKNDFVNGGEMRQTDLYLTPGDQNIYKEDRALRIRTEERGGRTECFLTYKGGNRDAAYHDREEIETAFTDSGALLTVFERLGFREVLKVEKVRTTYNKDNLTIAIDRVTGLGHFLEIEYITDDEKTVDAAKARIDGVLSAIGLTSARPEPKNYLVLLAESGSVL